MNEFMSSVLSFKRISKYILFDINDLNKEGNAKHDDHISVTEQALSPDK